MNKYKQTNKTECTCQRVKVVVNSDFSIALIFVGRLTHEGMKMDQNRQEMFGFKIGLKTKNTSSVHENKYRMHLKSDFSDLRRSTTEGG